MIYNTGRHFLKKQYKKINLCQKHSIDSVLGDKNEIFTNYIFL
jgi:hypothetical protein